MLFLAITPALLWLAAQAWVEAGPLQAISAVVFFVAGAITVEIMER